MTVWKCTLAQAACEGDYPWLAACESGQTAVPASLAPTQRGSMSAARWKSSNYIKASKSEWGSPCFSHSVSSSGLNRWDQSTAVKYGGHLENAAIYLFEMFLSFLVLLRPLGIPPLISTSITWPLTLKRDVTSLDWKLTARCGEENL